MIPLAFHGGDPAGNDFQFLEDLATAYWHSEVLFAALEIGLFDHLGDGGCDTARLARRIQCRPDELECLLAALQRLELVGHADGTWFNQPSAARHLVSGRPGYLGHFLLYRRYMKPAWEGLGARLGRKAPAQPRALSPEDDYRRRNFHYVRAMDALSRVKAADIVARLPHHLWRGPLLDIGGGAGALSRALIREHNDRSAWLLELPEVIRAAGELYPRPEDWRRIRPVAGDFRHHPFSADKPFGLVLMGNFLHAYGAGRARDLLEQAVSLVAADGLLMIHDYFPDRTWGPTPHKGAFYDLCMLLNTCDGRCHASETVGQWLEAAGMGDVRVLDLSSDSSLVLAARTPGRLAAVNHEDWVGEARRLGFRHAAELPAERIVLGAWTVAKCRFGCAQYGEKLQCPPNAMGIDETRALLSEYRRALLVEGAPPGLAFHENLLALERRAFLAGHPRALVFGAGPCPLCPACPTDGKCVRPEKARPSMEAAGIDVYTTARRAGIFLEPVPRKGDYVKYLGLLLLE